MRDFTLSIYTKLLESLKKSGYSAQTFQEFLQKPLPKAVILRHDVDKMPKNSLTFARVESEMGLQASYYFRIVPESFQPEIIKEIAALGHEIGYHYVDMDICRGDIDQAHSSFAKNLARLRELAPVNTICMHGSPLSKHDNRDLWTKHDYRQHGIIGEPYFDLDYSQVFYITDTGRKWNNAEASIRDKVSSPFSYQIKNTAQFIHLIEKGELPDQMMINTHPQRWNDNLLLWMRELVWQGAKNQVKRMVSRRSSQKKAQINADS